MVSSYTPRYTSIVDVRDGTTTHVYATTNETNVAIKLPDTYTIEITQVKKNGSVDTNWAFIPPDTLRMTITPQASDYFEISREIILTDDQIALAIHDAESRVDSYLAKAYSLPLASVPHVIHEIATTWARALVIKKMDTHSQYNAADFEVQQANQDIQDCVTFLKELTMPDSPLELTDATGALFARRSNFGKLSTYVGVDDSTEAV